MRVHFVYHKISHHSEHSGYDQIARYIPHEHLGHDWSGRLIRRMKDTWRERLVRGSDLNWYSGESLSHEAQAVVSFLTNKRHVYHYLYGEDHYYYLSKVPNWGKNRTVVTYHQPPSYFTEAVSRPDHMKRADRIIALSNDQRDYFAEIVGGEKVTFIPHGVDTEFFVPPRQRVMHDPVRCLFVGHWLRDMQLLASVLRVFQERGIDYMKFRVVTLDRYFPVFEGLNNVELISGVPDSQLRELYQSSDLLFLPLLDCTANNSILEAMACGLPVMTTDVEAMRDYVGDHSAVLLPPGDLEAAVEGLCGLIGDQQRLDKLSRDANQRAKEYSWPVIADRVRQVYREISE